MSEALANPAEEIFDVIRYFGERKKIFNVHFRNIKGGLGNFVEVFPDEGDINMIRALKVYKEVGYEYMIMPDHVPWDQRPRAGQSRVCLYLWLYPRGLAGGGGVSKAWRSLPFSLPTTRKTYSLFFSSISTP